MSDDAKHILIFALGLALAALGCVPQLVPAREVLFPVASGLCMWVVRQPFGGHQ
jgi:hypothetical protein